MNQDSRMSSGNDLEWLVTARVSFSRELDHLCSTIVSPLATRRHLPKFKRWYDQTQDHLRFQQKARWVKKAATLRLNYITNLWSAKWQRQAFSRDDWQIGRHSTDQLTKTSALKRLLHQQPQQASQKLLTWKSSKDLGYSLEYRFHANCSTTAD